MNLKEVLGKYLNLSIRIASNYLLPKTNLDKHVNCIVASIDYLCIKRGNFKFPGIGRFHNLIPLK